MHALDSDGSLVVYGSIEIVIRYGALPIRKPPGRYKITICGGKGGKQRVKIEELPALPGDSEKIPAT